MITLIIFVTIIYSVYREFQSGMSQRGNEVLKQFNQIHANLRTESELITKFVATGKKYAENYLQSRRQEQSSWFKDLKFDKKLGGYYLKPSDPNYFSQKMGNLTSTLHNLHQDPEKKVEINMVLNLGSFLAATLSEVKASPWFYYTSSDFIYLAPYVPPTDFFFSKDLLKEKDFYRMATPEMNPERKGFWTSVYEDAAGLGLMITYSEPVYFDNKFKGAISMDVTLDQFNNAIKNSDLSIGTMVLYNRQNQVLAEPSRVASRDSKISKASEIVPVKLQAMAGGVKNEKLQSLVKLDANFVYFEDFPELAATLVFFVPASDLVIITLKKMSGVIVVSLLCFWLLFWLRRTFLNDLVMQQNFIENAKMSALGRMAAGMAHEINNPLAIIVGKTNVLKRLVDSGGVLDLAILSQHLEKILSTANRITKIINSLRSFSRKADQDPFFEVNLKDWLNETLVLCKQTLASEEISLEVDDVPSVTIQARESQLSQVLINLINNSADAVKNRPAKFIKISFTQSKSQLSIYIRDSGDKIPKEVQGRLMEPFFTTKPPGVGTGLGLSISLTIMKEHGGNIKYLPEDPLTCFVIEIPLKT
ncbi:MAG: GHKL domain-containing protein [Bdellovibrionaceae bacterium]|nr:GHKL domain-containing protein [Pseudobdellovibrionaceae bacterium]